MNRKTKALAGLLIGIICFWLGIGLVIWSSL
jgi:hypothetical protein